MYVVTYLSNTDRERLIEIKQALTGNLPPDQRSTLMEEMVRIENSAKPLGQCSYREVMELKTHIYDKYRKLQGVGKLTAARQLQFMLQALDGRIQTIMLAERRQREQAKAEQPPEIKNAISPSRVSNGKRRNTWTIGTKADD